MARIKAYDLINVSDIGRNDAFLIETDGGTKTVNAYDLINEKMKYVVLPNNKSLNDVTEPGVIYRDNSGAFLRYGICLVDSTGKPNMQFAIRSDGSIKYRSWKNTGWDVAWTDTSQNIPVERIQQAVENYLREHPIASGKSAYEIALEEGYQGTKAEWLVSLKGAKGKSTADAYLQNGLLHIVFEEETVVGGTPTTQVTDKTLGYVVGPTGRSGDKGRSIVDANIDIDGNLILTCEDYAGDETAVGFFNAGHVVGPPGNPGDRGEDGDDYVLTEEDKNQIAELAADKIIVQADTLADCVEPDVFYIVDNDDYSGLPREAAPPYKVSCVREFNGDVVRQYIFDHAGHIYTRFGILDETVLNPVYSAIRIATIDDIPSKTSDLENDSGFITASRVAKLESQYRISDSFSMDLSGVPITILSDHPAIDVGDFGQEDSSDNANVYYIYISADVTRIKQGALMTTPHNLPSLVCVYIDRDVTEVEQSIEPGAPVTEGMLGIETGAISSRVYIYYKGNFHIFDELVSAIRNVDRRLTAAIIDKDVDRLGEKVKFIETSDPDTAVENGIWYRVHTDSEDYALFAISTSAQQAQFRIKSTGTIGIRRRYLSSGGTFPAWGEFDQVRWKQSEIENLIATYLASVKTQTITAQSTHDQIPTAKAVYDYLQGNYINVLTDRETALDGIVSQEWEIGMRYPVNGVETWSGTSTSRMSTKPGTYIRFNKDDLIVMKKTMDYQFLVVYSTDNGSTWTSTPNRVIPYSILEDSIGWICIRKTSGTFTEEEMQSVVNNYFFILRKGTGEIKKNALLAEALSIASGSFDRSEIIDSKYGFAYQDAKTTDTVVLSYDLLLPEFEASKGDIFAIKVSISIDYPDMYSNIGVRIYERYNGNTVKATDITDISDTIIYTVSNSYADAIHIRGLLLADEGDITTRHYEIFDYKISVVKKLPGEIEELLTEAGDIWEV